MKRKDKPLLKRWPVDRSDRQKIIRQLARDERRRARDLAKSDGAIQADEGATP